MNTSMSTTWDIPSAKSDGESWQIIEEENRTVLSARHTDRKIPPADVFEKLVWFNRESCNECFSKIRKITTGRVATGVGYRDFEHHDRVGEGVRGHDEVKGAFKPRTFCRRCGGRGRCHSDILSTQQMVDRVPELVERVCEQGVDVDEDAVYEFIRTAKTMDYLQGRDREIFEGAIRVGIEFAYGLR